MGIREYFWVSFSVALGILVYGLKPSDTLNSPKVVRMFREDAGVAVMAGPKKGAKHKAAPEPTGDRVAIIHLKGTPEFAEWLESVHKATHIPKASIVRLALKEWAENHGHAAPPEA
jgi:hypothetical protein